MTAPQQKIFNPAQLKDSNQEERSQAQQSTRDQKDYPLTGVSSRDQVRKLIFEAFQEDSKDPKSKQYRDKSRAVQVKLKGPRLQQTRKDLRTGKVEASYLIRDDYVQGKYQTEGISQQQQLESNQVPSQTNTNKLPPTSNPGGMGGAPGFRPPGPPGMFRPRMGQPQMFRPPMGIARPPPVAQIPTQNIAAQIQQEEEQQQQKEEKKDKPQETIQAQPIQKNKNPEYDPNTSKPTPVQNKDSSQSLVSLTNLNKQDAPQNKIDTARSEQLPLQIQQVQQEQQQRQQVEEIQNSHSSPSQDDQNQNQPYDSHIDQQFTHQSQHDYSIAEISVADKDEGENKLSGKKKGKKKKKKTKKVDKSLNMNDQSQLTQEGQGTHNQQESDLQQQQPIFQEEEVKEIERQEQQNHPQQEQILEQQQPLEILHAQQDRSIDAELEDRFKLSSKYDFIGENSIVQDQRHDESIDLQVKSQLNSSQQIQENQFHASPNSQGQQEELVQQNQIRVDQFEKEDHKQENLSKKPSQIEEEKLDVMHNLLQEEQIKKQSRRQSKHTSKQPSGDYTSNIGQSRVQDVQNMIKQNKPLSVKSLSSQQQNAQESETIKRLQDALQYKRTQKKDLTERLTHLENDCHLQVRKAQMLMEENKQLRDELRQKDRQLKQQESHSHENMIQIEAKNKKLESSLKQQQIENEQLKREVQKHKDEKVAQRERISQYQEETQNQRQILDMFLKQLENRITNSNIFNSHIIGNSGESSLASGGNQQDQLESMQKELQQMKAQYDQKVRELTEELQNKTRMLQRTERQNLQLQEKNIHLSEVLSQVEVQQLSTVAGSGSNQRDSSSMFNNRRQGFNEEGGITGQQDTHMRNYQYEGVEEEGTGGDRGYSSQYQNLIMRNQEYNLVSDEGGNAAVVGGMINDNFEEDDNNDDDQNQRNNRPAYQTEAVSGGHPQFEEDNFQEEDDDEEDEDYEDDDGEVNEDEDEEGNQFDDNNTQGIASAFGQTQSRDNQNLGYTFSQTNIVGQSDEIEGYAGGQQTHQQTRQRKQGQRNKRGNRQQNQQQTSSGNSNLPNPRQRNSRGRQQRSNQQHIQQQQIQSHSQSQAEQTIAPPSSQVAQNQMRQTQQQQQQNEFFQSYGDSSSLFSNNQNRDQSQSLNVQNQIPQREGGGGVAGAGVVLTAGRQNNAQSTIESLMSAESGSTASAFYDKGQYHRGQNNAPQPRSHQSNTHQSVFSNQQQFQTGSNNNQFSQQQQQTYPSISNDLFGENDNYTAAVGAPTSRAAAHPRQQRQQQQTSNNQQQQQQVYGVYNFNNEETKQQNSGEIYSQYFGSSAGNQLASSRITGQQQPYNQFVGGSGEQEEDSSGVFSGNSGFIQQQQQMNFFSHAGAGSGAQRNQSSVQQLRTGGGIMHQNIQQQQQQDQSNTPTRNDSRKTSGANTPNKDGADTPTTKAYRGQQLQNSYLRAFDGDLSKSLTPLFFNDDPKKVDKWHSLFKDQVFYPLQDLPLDKQRQIAYDRLKKVADAKLFSIFDFDNDPKNLITAHEMLGLIDGSLATKFTVQFNLFGGTLMATHTERHLPFMKKVDSLEHMGCFCFTELGYGNNAVKMETTAIYDEQSKTFTINSPTTLSQKYWITNGACHANYAIVFAQTIVKGKNEGVNPFIVRIRDDQMKECAGVEIEDMGVKLGLNGVDNAKLKFTQVKIPRENMLNKLNDVTESGEFKSPIEKPTNRFFKVADRLLSGRLCISAMCLSSTKLVLFTTVRYSQQRLGVGVSSLSDTPIMAYQLQQNALVPLVARTAVLNFGFNSAKELFAHPEGQEHTLIRTFCVVKTMLSWNLGTVSTICRERCGGGGYTGHSRLHEGLAGAHSGMTAEGDNRVLMQKVVKDLLADMQKEQHRLPAMTQCPRRQIPNMDKVTDLETLTNLIYYREVAEIQQMSSVLKKKVMDEGKPFFDVWMYEVSDEIQSLAQAFGERYCLESALQVLAKTTEPKLKALLTKIIRLHSISLVKENLGWYLMNGVVKASAAKDLELEYQQAVKQVVPHLNDILEAYNLPKIPQIQAPIARDYVKFNAQSDPENVNAAGDFFDFRSGPKL